MSRRKEAPQKETGEKDYRFMSALARGLSVLRAFGPDNRPLGNGEIAERVGLPKPTVSRITFTLTELGYLDYVEDSGRYRLGPGILTLGYDVLAQMEIRDIARPYMQELANYANASIYLGVPNGLEIIYIEACRAPASMAIRLGVGSRIPLPTTGMGRAYLAALPEADRKALIARLKVSYGDDWKTVEPGMTKAIAETTERGFSLAIGEWVSEANSAGAAIRRSDGYPAYAINVGGLRSIITRERLEKDLGPRVLGVARQIELVARGLL
ncbi:IclR family transcriptional regulator [Rhodobium gokarnense]|uniref:DNA-binding IclR family transcriptional regulator n=1 Tax=Rhodobium gokarnense TaxID=364296 RepID=A0ABT3HEW8_9HYPH|nr:IclR family transcriptional regulator [Rhodobium gokarnense]MCW2308940.1 DNA-binding IclR family transcriptional regulator [Rhodobium gokarnense]